VIDLSETGTYKPLFAELRRLGYVEGQNLVVERFSARGDASRYDTIIRDAVSSSPDVILITGTDELVVRVKAAVHSIPVVATMSDPIAFGTVGNLARPEGNITGISVDAGIGIWGKRLAIFLEAFPTARRVGFLCTEAYWSSPSGDVVRTAARNASLTIVGSPMGVLEEPEYLRVFDLLQREHADGLLVNETGDHLFYRHLIVDLAERARLPTLYAYREYVDAGGLMAYAIDRNYMYRQAAHYIDMIFNGAKPGDIPIYQMDKHSMVINLRAAKSQGIEIPASLVLRADEVIE
jgi:putative ABC transport system substrate-binding protein